MQTLYSICQFKSLFIIFIIEASFFRCSKNDSDDIAPDNPEIEAMDFEITLPDSEILSDSEDFNSETGDEIGEQDGDSSQDFGKDTVIQCQKNEDCIKSVNETCKLTSCLLPEGICKITSAPDNTVCNDGNYCTNNDRCLKGICTPESTKICSDDNICTDDQCDPETGNCLFAPSLTQKICEDGNLCTLNDFCDKGQCISMTQKCPEESNPCKDNKCDPETGECIIKLMLDGSECDDGDAQTVPDFCLNGKCSGFRTVTFNFSAKKNSLTRITSIGNKGYAIGEYTACNMPDCSDNTYTDYGFISVLNKDKFPVFIEGTLTSGILYRDISENLAVGDKGIINWNNNGQWIFNWKPLMDPITGGADGMPFSADTVWSTSIGGECSKVWTYLIAGRNSKNDNPFSIKCILNQYADPVTETCLTNVLCDPVIFQSGNESFLPTAIGGVMGSENFFIYLAGTKNNNVTLFKFEDLSPLFNWTSAKISNSYAFPIPSDIAGTSDGKLFFMTGSDGMFVDNLNGGKWSFKLNMFPNQLKRQFNGLYIDEKNLYITGTEDLKIEGSETKNLFLIIYPLSNQGETPAYKEILLESVTITCTEVTCPFDTFLNFGVNDIHRIPGEGIYIVGYKWIEYSEVQEGLVLFLAE
jgi:hypothetical protein